MKHLLKKTLDLSNQCSTCYHSFSNNEYDVLVIGGGIIGAAIGKKLKETKSDLKIAIIEKEADIGIHQTGHNSQVIHAGIYYKPNSLKAKFCVEGLKLIYDYCEDYKIPVKKSGKLIIGKDFLDQVRLTQLYKQGLVNKVPALELLKDKKTITDIQPNCNCSTALWSPFTGNVDWKLVAESFAKDFKDKGGQIFFNCEVKSVKESVSPDYPIKMVDSTGSKYFCTKFLVLSMGLYSGTLLESDQNAKYKNISLKVDYYLLNSKLRKFIKTNIYALPHLDMPFLGIHFSPIASGDILLGPNAVPTFSVDGYTQFPIDFQYLQKNVLSKHLGLLFLKNLQTCVNQFTERVVCEVRHATLKNCFPMLSKSDIHPGPTAVQAQLVTESGEFVDDFLIEMFEGEGINKRIINCRFIPSPGATCSLALANKISNELAPRLEVSNSL